METRRFLGNIEPRPDLEKLLAAARERWNRLTPEQRRKMYAMQQRSWAIGELMMSHTGMTREAAEEIYEKASAAWFEE